MPYTVPLPHVTLLAFHRGLDAICFDYNQEAGQE